MSAAMHSVERVKNSTVFFEMLGIFDLQLHLCCRLGAISLVWEALSQPSVVAKLSIQAVFAIALL